MRRPKNAAGGVGWRRLPLLLAGLVLASAAPGLSQPTTMSPIGDAPNVLVILTDDMRYDDLAHLPRVQSLLVDRGTTFTRFYSTFPLCCPARASMLNGQYAHNHGVLGNFGPHGGFTAFDDDHTLATWLDPTHTTGWVGKYMNEYDRPDHWLYVPPGWDVWRGAVGRTYNYRNVMLSIDGDVLHSFPGQLSTRVIADESLEFLDDHGDEPFFLVASFVAPHGGRPADPDDLRPRGTVYVGPRYRDSYAGPAQPADPSFNERDVSDKRPSVRDNPPLTEAEIATVREVFAQRRESLRALDDQVARLVRELRQQGQLRNTYLVFLSDNGFLQGEHRIPGGKGLPYTPALHVPLVVRGPGIPAGVTVDGMAAMHDIAPTVLRMAQATLPDGVFDGRSLLPLVRRPSAADRRTLVIEAGDGAGGYSFRGILRGDGWKYIEFTGLKEVEMYDLASDPFELRNLAGDPRYAAQRARLARQLDQLKDCAGTECP